jgi:hypothetical protein
MDSTIAAFAVLIRLPPRESTYYVRRNRSAFVNGTEPKDARIAYTVPSFLFLEQTKRRVHSDAGRTGQVCWWNRPLQA